MRLHLDENFENVNVDLQAVADPVFVEANEEHDENKENYEAAMEANKEATEGLTPEEGESIEVEKREVLKQMHLEESLFTEEVEDDNLYDAYLNAIREEEKNPNSDISAYNVYEILRDKQTGWNNFVVEWADDFNLSEDAAREIMMMALEYFLGEDLNESLEDSRVQLSDEQRERAYQALEMAEIVDNDLDENGNPFYDKGNLMSQDWFLVKRTEGDIEDYPYTLMVNDWAWDDVTEHGFKEIIGELEEDFKKGDKFKNQNDATIEILDADNDFVTYEIKAKGDYIGDGHITDPKSVETVIRMNGYEKISESMEEIDRQVFGSLNKETREPGVYYVLVDQNFDHKIYADSDEEAIEKFRAQLNESLDVDASLTSEPEFYIDGGEVIDGKSEGQLAIAYVIDDGSVVIRKNLSRELTDEEKNKILNFVHDNYAEDAEILDESLETSDFEERKENARLMHEVMKSMNDEEAYFTWIYVMPDEPNEYDFEWFAEEDAEYTDLCMEFDNIYNKYGKEGLFDPSDEVVKFLEDNNYEVNIVRPEIKEEYDPDLGGDTEDYKLDVESIKKALSGLQFGTLRAEDLVDEFIETLENWMPMDESLKESARPMSALEFEVLDILRRNGYKIYPTDIEAYADYIKMIRKETGEDYSVAQWFKDTEAMSKEESGLEEVDDDLEESLIYNVAKEQLKRFTEGKMGDSWNPKIYLERLANKKYLNEEQIKKLNESVSMQTIQDYRKKINDLKSIDDIKEYCDQYDELFYVNNGEDELQIFMTDKLGDDNLVTSVYYSDFE